MNRDTDIKGQAILFSEMTPPEGREGEFNLWYDEHHSPSHVKGVPGLKVHCDTNPMPVPITWQFMS